MHANIAILSVSVQIHTKLYSKLYNMAMANSSSAY